ncbi:phosphomethylpyrimidine kinase [Moritella sp. PE36]|nr:phosphomethylpyrimidine kinase [Moritella sp. PE36]
MLFLINRLLFVGAVTVTHKGVVAMLAIIININKINMIMYFIFCGLQALNKL